MKKANIYVYVSMDLSIPLLIVSISLFCHHARQKSLGFLSDHHTHTHTQTSQFDNL